MSYVANPPNPNKVADMRKSNATKAMSAVSSFGPPLRVRHLHPTHVLGSTRRESSVCG